MLDIGIVGFGVLAGGVIAYVTLQQTLPLMPFLYANARIYARSKYLILDEQWDSFAEASSLPELTILLSGTDYVESLEKASEDVREYHIAIEKSFATKVEELKKMTPRSIYSLFDAYLMFWESKMLKTFYRKLLTAQELDSRLVFPVGRIDQLLLAHLMEAETIADMRVIMSETSYGPIFEKEYDNLEQFEASLDNFVFHYFVEKVRKTRIYNGEQVIELLNLKFDVQNLLVLLKLEARNAPVELRREYLIKNDTELYKLTPELIRAKDLREFVETCSRLPYYETLKEALSKYEKDKSLSHFEHELQRYFKTRVLKLEKLYFQGPYPLFTYLVKKEFELRNLMVISKGIDAKMSTEKIRELVI